MQGSARNDQVWLLVTLQEGILLSHMLGPNTTPELAVTFLQCELSNAIWPEIITIQNSQRCPNKPRDKSILQNTQEKQSSGSHCT